MPQELLLFFAVTFIILGIAFYIREIVDDRKKAKQFRKFELENQERLRLKEELRIKEEKEKKLKQQKEAQLKREKERKQLQLEKEQHLKGCNSKLRCLFFEYLGN